MTKASTLVGKDLLGIAGLQPGEIQLILDTAESFAEVSQRPIKKVPTLRGRTVMNLFFESSTRTRSSFEVAQKRLSADNINFSTGGSSMSKGESLLDTAETLQAMGPDLVVIRHAHSRVPHALAQRIEASVVNGGDGAHEHPTQALLDAFTIRRHKGRLEGLKVAILGDVEHSRVLRSNVHLLTKMGAKVVVAGPRTMLPQVSSAFGVEVTSDYSEALSDADVVMMLRVQLERQSGVAFPSVREYFHSFALTAERLALAKEDAIVMHPGPMNRGVEIASDVADSERAVVLEQVTHGVAVRMAVMYLLVVAR